MQAPSDGFNVGVYFERCVVPVDSNEWVCFVSEYLGTRDERSGGAAVVCKDDEGGGRMNIFDATVRSWPGSARAATNRRPS